MELQTVISRKLGLCFKKGSGLVLMSTQFTVQLGLLCFFLTIHLITTKMRI